MDEEIHFQTIAQLLGGAEEQRKHIYLALNANTNVYPAWRVLETLAGYAVVLQDRDGKYTTKELCATEQQAERWVRAQVPERPGRGGKRR